VKRKGTPYRDCRILVTRETSVRPGDGYYWRARIVWPDGSGTVATGVHGSRSDAVDHGKDLVDRQLRSPWIGDVDPHSAGRW
jgi:hypothetical protein